MTAVASIKSRHPLPPFLIKDGLKLKPCSGHWTCLCPFHREKTPSCHVWDDHFFCFGCNQRGDVLDYLQQTRSLTFPEAVSILTGREPSPAPAPFIVERKEERHRVTPRDFSSLATKWSAQTGEDQMNDLAAKLGVSAEALWWLGAGWSSEHKAWSFPMMDAHDRAIGIRLRDERGRKWAVTGSHNGMFIPLGPIQNRIYVCEGPTDTAAALSFGLYSVGRPSCSSGEAHVIEFVKRHREIREVVLMSDNDSAGLKGAKSLREKLNVRSWLLLLPMKDIRRYCQLGGERAMIEAMIKAQVPKVRPL